METSRFDAKVRHRAGVAVIDLAGDIDKEADDAMSAAYTEAASREPATILLNFDAVDYINSTGIALIVGLLARARKDGGTVVSCGLSDHYQEIFEITRLADFMRMFPDEESAVAEAPAAAP